MEAPQDQHTNAEHRGGTFRSSEEASVMEVEPRECIVQVLNQCYNRSKGWDDYNERNETIYYF